MDIWEALKVRVRLYGKIRAGKTIVGCSRLNARFSKGKRGRGRGKAKLSLWLVSRICYGVAHPKKIKCIFFCTAFVIIL